jgi:phage terminase large subunit-like protein
MLQSLASSQKVELLQMLQERERRAARRLLFTLYPEDGPLRRELYPKHMEFFALGAVHRERAAIAANRVGKTFGIGGYETALHLTGRYPDWWVGKRFDGPVNWWAAGKSNETCRDIVQSALFGSVIFDGGRKSPDGRGLIPGDDIVTWNWKAGVVDLIDTAQIKHVSGGNSTIGLKSYQQGRGAFEGTAQHGIWVDEEPDMPVYTECLTRTMTTDGMIIATFTPLEGMSDVVMAYLHPETMR